MGILQESDELDVGAVPVCGRCRSEQVVKEAWATWNSETGLWEVLAVFEKDYCHVCQDKTEMAWTRPKLPPIERIRALNDELRQNGCARNGLVVATRGIQSLGENIVRDVIDAVRRFDDFSGDNDPWGEHDFGALDVAGHKIFWKIDYCDLSLSAGSPNPANPQVTKRVLTIMLAEEY